MRWCTLILTAACGMWIACPAGASLAAPQNPVSKAVETPDGDQRVSEREAVAAFKEIGATVEFDFQGHVLSVEAAGDKLTDGVVGKLAACTSLESLDLGKSKISDAALRAIGGLASLQRLYVHDVPLTDNAIAHLQGLSHLTVLCLKNTKVRGAGLAMLTGHKTCESSILAAPRSETTR